MTIWIVLDRKSSADINAKAVAEDWNSVAVSADSVVIERDGKFYWANSAAVIAAVVNAAVPMTPRTAIEGIRDYVMKDL